jgi:hypothetical protein
VRVHYARLRELLDARPFKRYPNASAAWLGFTGFYFAVDLALYGSQWLQANARAALAVLAVLTVALACGAGWVSHRHWRLRNTYISNRNELSRVVSNPQFRRWLNEAPENRWFRRVFGPMANPSAIRRLPPAVQRERAAVFTVSAKSKWKDWH